MLIVTGYVHLAPADVAAFVADMAAFADAARARDGCLFFAVATDSSVTGRMLVSERWRDQTALAVHLAADETAAFTARWRGRMRGDLAVFDAAHERSLMEP